MSATDQTDAIAVGPILPLPGWIAACGLAEAVGMAASATAAKVAGNAATPAIALTIIVVGGLVEGLALGTLQGAVLKRWLRGFNQGLWVLVTTIVAGIGWAAAAAPSQISPDYGDSPVLLIMLGGAVVLGGLMGAVLGAAQAIVLGRRVTHPERWIGVCAIGWAPAMAIIFLGATTPNADWSLQGVIALGAVTGAVAGSVLGLITGVLTPWLAGHPASNAIVIEMLESPIRRLFEKRIIGLRLRGRRTGATIQLPVQFVEGPDGLVIFPSNAAKKNWWRNLSRAARVDILRAGIWVPSSGQVVRGDDPSWARSRAAYLQRWPNVLIPTSSPLVVLAPLDPNGIAAEQSRS